MRDLEPGSEETRVRFQLISEPLLSLNIAVACTTMTPMAPMSSPSKRMMSSTSCPGTPMGSRTAGGSETAMGGGACSPASWSRSPRRMGRTGHQTCPCVALPRLLPRPRRVLSPRPQHLPRPPCPRPPPPPPRPPPGPRLDLK